MLMGFRAWGFRGFRVVWGVGFKVQGCGEAG